MSPESIGIPKPVGAAGKTRSRRRQPARVGTAEGSGFGYQAAYPDQSAKYLEEFEANCIQNGIQVHWAKDGAEHNRIVHEILANHQVKKLVKSKSMLTEECHLNPFLESKGIEVIDTDLGERIIQLKKQPPSHIVVPAIHLKKEEVGELFHEKLGTEAGASDPTYLTRAARAICVSNSSVPMPP